MISFSGLYFRGPLARCLRIAGVVTHTFARLASRLSGSTVAGWGLNPQDGGPIFRASSHPPFLSDQDFLVALPSRSWLGGASSGGEVVREDRQNAHLPRGKLTRATDKPTERWMG